MWLNYVRGETTYLHTGYDLEREIRACAAPALAA